MDAPVKLAITNGKVVSPIAPPDIEGIEVNVGLAVLEWPFRSRFPKRRFVEARDLKPFEPIEFRADYCPTGGLWSKRRWCGVVLSVDANALTVQPIQATHTAAADFVAIAVADQLRAKAQEETTGQADDLDTVA